ncbi:MAG: tetratricopeptide repeat protein, partial [Myxococcota bacterium]
PPPPGPPPPPPPPPQQARLQAARGVLKRVGRLMTNEQSRLEYDFRHGHIRAKERLAAAHAGKGPSLEVLRRTWNRVSHERVDQAALLTRRAFAARQAKRWDEAIRFAKKALTLNPFFEELEKTLEAWELSASADLMPTFQRSAPRKAPSSKKRSAARS